MWHEEMVECLLTCNSGRMLVKLCVNLTPFFLIWTQASGGKESNVVPPA